MESGQTGIRVSYFTTSLVFVIQPWQLESELLAPKILLPFPIYVGSLCAASYKRINKERDQQRRFRRDPDGYLIELESCFLQLALPR